MKDTLSMFEPIYNDGGDTIYLSDQLEDSKNIMKNIDLRIAVNEAINNLRDKEKYIITQRYLIGKTQMELSEEIGISQAQISRLEKSGLQNIKKNINWYSSYIIYKSYNKLGDIMRLSDLQNKEIININDGKKVGNIIDIVIDKNGRSDGIIVEKSKFIISRFTNNGEIEIKWNQIERIGEDVILVNIVY